MIIHIDYHAAYEYEAEVSLSPHVVRVFPRRDMFVRVLDLHFHCGGGADIQFRRDLFDNETAYCFFPPTPTPLTSRFEPPSRLHRAMRYISCSIVTGQPFLRDIRIPN